MDQATSLRKMFRTHHHTVMAVMGDMQQDHAARTAACIAQAWIKEGKQVCVVDGSAKGLARMHGLPVKFELLHALRGDLAIEDLIHQASPQLQVIPAHRAFADDAFVQKRLEQMHGLHARMPGVVDCVIWVMPYESFPWAQAMLPAGAQCVWSVSVSQREMPKAYHALKHMARERSDLSHRWIPSACAHARQADEVFANVWEVCQTFMSLPLQYGGFWTRQDLSLDWTKTAWAAPKALQVCVAN